VLHTQSEAGRGVYLAKKGGEILNCTACLEGVGAKGQRDIVLYLCNMNKTGVLCVLRFRELSLLRGDFECIEKLLIDSSRQPTENMLCGCVGTVQWG